MSNVVDLSKFDANTFDKGAGLLKRTLWYFVNALFVRCSLNPFMRPKIWLLKAFGAQIGHGVVIKNEVNVKSPWHLVLGENVWLGEKVWIDNLDRVCIGNNVCISQGAMLLTGNHDYQRSDFAYRNAPIVIEEGAWIAAKSVVCPGVTVHSHAILGVGSVARTDLEAYKIYSSVPAQYVRDRIVE